MVVEVLPNGVESHHTEQATHRIVLKFGGTSIGKFAPAVAKICVSSLRDSQIAIICSARSGRSKATGTTNLLLKAAREASKAEGSKHDAIVSDVLRDHVHVTESLPPSLAAPLVREFNLEIDDLRQKLAALPKTGVVAPEDEDRVARVGERLSARYLAALLEDHGVQSEFVDLSNVIDFPAHHGLDPHFYQELAPAIGRRVLECGDRVPVVTGFFGGVPGGLLNSCGRGYSDLLASLVAVGLDANELQIWKELSGVYTADPRKVPTAKLLTSIHPSEANELTFYGSEVIHHFTIEQCIPKIPIRIKNVLDPQGSGTIIFLDNKKPLDPYLDQRPKRPTAVTAKHQITVVNVHSHRKVESPEFLAQICTTLARWSLAVDLFEKNETHVSLAVHSRTPFIGEAGEKDKEDLQNQHKDLQNAIAELSNYGTVDVVHNMAILSLIGMQLKKSIGIAGRFFTALGNADINIEMISQGASEINISCVIEEREALRALNVVHTELFTFLE